MLSLISREGEIDIKLYYTNVINKKFVLLYDINNEKIELDFNMLKTANEWIRDIKTRAYLLIFVGLLFSLTFFGLIGVIVGFYILKKHKNYKSIFSQKILKN